MKDARCKKQDARISDVWIRFFYPLSFVFCLLFAQNLFGMRLLIYMDGRQTDHLRAYGIAYQSLVEDIKVEWLLNYRDGSFLVDYHKDIEDLCKIRGVSYSVVDESQVQRIYITIEENNMERILLEVAPKVAVYIPPNELYTSGSAREPWDDAVRLALDYAKIPYDKIWDEEVLSGALNQCDWLHLHHEDFSGQYGKFYASYRNTPWFQEEMRVNKLMAKRLGFKKVWHLKHAVTEKIAEYVNKGGFLFAMCSATETIDMALAAGNVDIVPLVDGDPAEPNCQQKLDFSGTFAFQNFKVDLNPLLYNHSDIDVSREAQLRGENVRFTLTNFSAKYDPIPTLLTQNHVRDVKQFLGQNTGFRRILIKKNVTILGEVKGTEEVKYIYGDYGKGFFTFYGGHDPEDYTHLIGDPATVLELHKNSPGYRLILNNILFPAAKSKRLKT